MIAEKNREADTFGYIMRVVCKLEEEEERKQGKDSRPLYSEDTVFLHLGSSVAPFFGAAHPPGKKKRGRGPSSLFREDAQQKKGTKTRARMSETYQIDSKIEI